jgi:hypothetical protein
MAASLEPVVEQPVARPDLLEQETGLDVPVHVDGASGAFVAPFVDPELEWDFRLPRVASINASGHKYGLVYPGVGWVVWRDADALPEDQRDEDEPGPLRHGRRALVAPARRRHAVGGDAVGHRPILPLGHAAAVASAGVHPGEATAGRSRRRRRGSPGWAAARRGETRGPEY